MVIVEKVYLADILDAILNFSKRSMMTECHHPESWMTMPVLEESIKKKTLYLISRSIKNRPLCYRTNTFSHTLYQPMGKIRIVQPHIERQMTSSAH